MTLGRLVTSQIADRKPNYFPSPNRLSQVTDGSSINLVLKSPAFTLTFIFTTDFVFFFLSKCLRDELLARENVLSIIMSYRFYELNDGSDLDD